MKRIRTIVKDGKESVNEIITHFCESCKSEAEEVRKFMRDMDA